METLIKLLFPTGSFSLASLVFAIMFTYIAIKAIYDAYKWIKARFDSYHEEKNGEEDKDAKIEKRIATLERHDLGQYNKLNELSGQIDKIVEMIETVQETQANAIVETYRGTIFRIYHDNMKQGYITQTELDRFISMVERYRKAGGNGVVDEKIYPEIMALDIKPE